MENRRPFTVVFLGLPEEFRRAHRSELNEINATAHWADDLRATDAPADAAVVVLNLDEKQNEETAGWEGIRARFPQAELVAVSGRDSAQLAMRCLHEGFADFLTQPVSRDELALCLLRSRQRQPSREGEAYLFRDISRALTQISSCSSTTTLRPRTLGVLQALLGGTGSAWVQRSGKGAKPLAALPAAPDKELLRRIAELASGRRKVVCGPDGQRKVLLPCHRERNGWLVVWGVTARLTRRRLDQALAILDHAEVALMNLRRAEKLKEQTFVDDLTGLYNSRYLRYALDAAASRFEKKKESFALLFLDMDKFKNVNDQHGHLVGSGFLGALGRIIKNAVRTGDQVFRFGGDEFVILLRNATSQCAWEIAERLRHHIENRKFVIRSIPLRTTVSVGLAAFPEHTKKIDTLVQLADEAMYQAKVSRNAVKIAATKSTRRRSSRRRLEPTL